VKIVFAQAADLQLDEITDWWLASRPGSTLLLRELDASEEISILAVWSGLRGDAPSLPGRR
jgi:hypothetical protein